MLPGKNLARQARDVAFAAGLSHRMVNVLVRAHSTST
jgi:hypothetical protein